MRVSQRWESKQGERPIESRGDWRGVHLMVAKFTDFCTGEHVTGYGVKVNGMIAMHYQKSRPAAEAEFRKWAQGCSNDE